MISFIICTYNRDKYIYQCLYNLANNHTKYPWEIILINNNSTDNTESECKRFEQDYSSIQYHYFIEKTPGLSFARNRGIKEAHGEWLVFLDDDSMVENNYIENLGKWLEKYPDAAAFGGPIEPFFEDKTPSWLSKWSMGFVSAINLGKEVKLFPKNQYPIGANMGIAKKAIQEIGNFNTALGRTKELLLGGEEKDIFMRIHKLGHPIYYFPNLYVKHCIPPKRTTTEFIKKLGYGVGVSEQLRTKSINKSAYTKRIFSEIIKWAGTIVLWTKYTITFQISKGNILVVFRYNVTKGLLKTT